MPGLVSVNALEGQWRLTRFISHAGGGENRFDGKARFTRSGQRLVLDEEGFLTGLPGQPEVKATRRYFWVQEADCVEVFFDDLRPFHSIPLNVAQPEARHFCAPDQYNVAYDFSDLTCWSATWRVTGPRKNYVMVSSFSRTP